MKDVSDVVYTHTKRVSKDFEIKNLDDLYVQSDTLMVDNVFNNFRNICLDIYGLDPALLLFARGFIW